MDSLLTLLDCFIYNLSLNKTIWGYNWGYDNLSNIEILLNNNEL